MKDMPLINVAFLIDKIGPSPTVHQVADFLNESVPTTWRRLKNGELEKLDGIGNTRVSLKSLADFLNRSIAYQVEYRRGKRKAVAK